MSLLIPPKEAFAEWEKGFIVSDAHLMCLEAFFADMLAGLEALGPRYTLATIAINAEHQRACAMIDRRRC